MLLTQSSLAVVVLAHRFTSAAAAEPLKDDVDVWKDDEWRGQDGTVVKRHDELVTLELPYLVRDGLHLKECVAKN